ncbi:MAG TPA: hypothetical protein VHJ17_18510, partial [Thermomonospora sp.]|nr:hypothetical protein [Thermomonospora sp.]
MSATGRVAAVCRRGVEGLATLLVRDPPVPGAAVRALSREVRALPGVREARVRTAGTPARPRLLLTVRCADPAGLYAALENGPVAACRRTAKMPELPVIINFEMNLP